MIELVIPRLLPSRNVADKMHWSGRHRLRKLWTQEIGWALAQQQYRFEPLEHAQVSIERRGLRTLDPDNLTASVKPVLDSLKANRVIVDDSPKHLELTVTQTRGTPQLTIRIQSQGDLP